MHIILTLQSTNEFFVGRLQCQNNMKLVFRISEDGSEIYHACNYNNSIITEESNYL
jgi:hypothetical protein